MISLNYRLRITIKVNSDNSYKWTQLDTELMVEWKDNYDTYILSQELIAYFQMFQFMIRSTDFISQESTSSNKYRRY